jgi:hypothetical protein
LYGFELTQHYLDFVGLEAGTSYNFTVNASGSTFTTSATTPGGKPAYFLAVNVTGAGTVRVCWSNLSLTNIGRNGTDTGGFGAWDTSMASPGQQQDIFSHRYVEFTGLRLGDTYTFTATGPGGPYTQQVTVH